jgi:CheY-like chemotaxis protein
MQAVGQLAGGVAHDFNNLLTAMIGFCDLLLLRFRPGDQSFADIMQIKQNANRAANLVRQLLAFSRQQTLQPRIIDIGEVLTELSHLLNRLLGENVDLKMVQSRNLGPVRVDQGQLEQVIINLAVNARDAMPEGGCLTIETANVHIDETYAAHYAEVSPGQYVVISVSDTGKGMDEATVARAFEPFFTTKAVGQGTGLGLSQVYGFVKQSGGHIKIYSEIGEGTTIKIYLPRLTGSAEATAEEEDRTAPDAEAEETILVLEDDDDVRTYSVEVLRDLGYRVVEAHDGASALRLLERQARVDLLFTDVVLPGGKTGAQVAELARELRPDLKVLFTTGYARNAIIHQGRLDKGVRLITKPFGSAELARKIRDVLDEGAY